eukprot:GHVU01159849.1.p1 GENE.GHVU01159849.1~~GHVU01159849.1.p1  ORF type:complete len:108 (+),score=12.31 GHVU01159849.1:504-827(+)
MMGILFLELAGYINPSNAYVDVQSDSDDVIHDKLKAVVEDKIFAAPVPAGIQGPLRAIVEACLQLDPVRRPTAAEVSAALNMSDEQALMYMEVFVESDSSSGSPRVL